MANNTPQLWQRHPPSPRAQASLALLRLTLSSLHLSPHSFPSPFLPSFLHQLHLLILQSDSQSLISGFLSHPDLRHHFLLYCRPPLPPASLLPSPPEDLPQHSGFSPSRHKIFVSRRLSAFLANMMDRFASLASVEARRLITLLSDVLQGRAAVLRSYPAGAQPTSGNAPGGLEYVDPAMDGAGTSEAWYVNVERAFQRVESFRETAFENSTGDFGSLCDEFTCLDFFILALDTLKRVCAMELSKAHINQHQCKVLQLAYKRLKTGFIDYMDLFSVVGAWHPFFAFISLFSGIGKQLCRILLSGHEVLEDCLKNPWSIGPVSRVSCRWSLQDLIEELDSHCTELVAEMQAIINTGRGRALQVPNLNLLELRHILSWAAEDDYSGLRLELEQIVAQHGSSDSINSEQVDPVAKARWLAERMECLTTTGVPQDRIFWLDPSFLKTERKLGKGSSADVYEVSCWTERYAMKTFHSGRVLSFRDEMFLHAKLHHPNIVQVIGYTAGVEAQNTKAILMELMTSDLRTLIDNRRASAVEGGRPFTQLVAVDIIFQIAKAMRYLHGNKVLHRDLKASNVLVGLLRSADYFGEGYIRVRVADFGEARENLECSKYLTAPIGTLAWRAPEIFFKQKHASAVTWDSFFKSKPPLATVSEYNAQADVYSFAITCYEVVSGNVPYSERPFHNESLLKQIVDGLRPTLPDYIHPDLHKLIKSCWDGKPDRRPEFEKICDSLRKIKFDLIRSSFHEDLNFMSN